MKRETLERYQAWIYLGSIVVGLFVGIVAPAIAFFWESLLWPVLGLLLYATFTQVPLRHLPELFKEGRFFSPCCSATSLSCRQ